jgi:hypothetical protein
MRAGLSAFLLVVAGVAQQGAAQADPPNFFNSNEAREFYACKTQMTFDSGHGTQVEYLHPNGRAFLWYPGNAGILPGEWIIEPRGAESPVAICFRYDTVTRNPVTGVVGREWSCMFADLQASRVAESARGDVLRLAGRKFIPFVLSRERTTIAALAARMRLPAARPRGC